MSTEGAESVTVTASAPSLRRSLFIQLRVIRALFLRELITRFGRHNLGVLWLVVEPIIFTLGVAALWSLKDLQFGFDIPIMAFALTGYSSVLLWRNTVGHNIHAIGENRNLLYHRNVRLLDVFVARILLEVAGATASFVVLSLVFIGLEVIAPPVDLLKVIVGWLMLAWFGGALALATGAACAFSELVYRVWVPTQYILFPLSGAAFVVSVLPDERLKSFVLLLPMVHGVEMVREGYFGDSVRSVYDLWYVGSVNSVLTLLGLLLLRLAARNTSQS